MDATKAARLRRAGWRIGTVADFLGLDESEAAYVEIKAGLAAAVSSRRRELRLSQTVAARRVGSSQSRLAKMEKADPSVSLDLLVRSLLALGLTRSEVAAAVVETPGRAVAATRGPGRRHQRSRAIRHRA